MRTTTRTLTSLLILLLGLVCFVMSLDSLASARRKSVLIFFPYESNLPGFIDFEAGFRSTLAESKDFQIEIYLECMDLLRFPDVEYHDKLMELYREKYSNHKIDLIVATLRPSLDFLAAYSPESLRNVPIVYFDHALGSLDHPTPIPVAAAVMGQLDMAGTLALAMRLHADVRNVFVVAGASELDQSFEAIAREALRSFENQVQLQYLSGLPMDELIQRVSSLPEHSLVFYVSIHRDGNGKTFKSPQALKLISMQANAPIYSVAETYIGRGMVGGHVISYPKEGAKTARVALRVLAGEEPDHLESHKDNGSQYIFDARELRRWGISEDLLPLGSEVRYGDFSLWVTYRWQIVAVVSVFIIQALLISALIISLRKQRRTDLALREAELKYRTVAEFTHDWEYWSAPDGKLLYVSPACERLTGFTSQDFMGDPALFRKLVHPEDRAAWDEHVRDTRAEQKLREIQLRIQPRDGNIRWIEHACRPVTDEQGGFQGIRASNRDITERRQMLDTIQRAADEWQATFDSITDLIMLLDREYRIRRVNAATVAFLGLPLDDILGKHCYSVIHGTAAPPDDCPFARMLANGEHGVVVLRDGNRDAWLSVSIDPIFNDRKEITGVVHTIKDVTEQKRAEETIRTSEEFNRAVLASLKNHVAILDKNGTILAVNEAWKQFARQNGAVSLAGLGPGVNYLEVCRRSIQTPGDASSQALDGILTVLDGKGDAFALEYTCDAPTESRWFLMKAMPFKNPGGGAVVSHTNITERKAAELEAQLRREELAHVTRIVTIGELATSLAHEINQPLTAILCNAEAAQRFLSLATPDLSEVGKILDDIIQDDRRAGEVIRRMRALVKKEPPRRETVVLNDAVWESIALVRGASFLEGLSIVAELDSELPSVQGDRVQLQQVVLNLLLNAAAAMRDTPPALRKLVVRTAKQDGRGVMVAIKDSGSGIDKNDMDRLFEPFYTTKADGLGMGLAISRAIIKAHSGTIGAENNQEGGATFYFTLPVDRGAPS